MSNPRIKELPSLGSSVDESMIIPIYDYATDTTYFVTIGTVLPASPTNDYRWDSGTNYPIGDIVTYNGQIWESLQDPNTGNIPFEGAFWTERSKAQSGLVRWVAGVFLDTDACVISNITGRDSVYILTVPAPFSSTDFLTELIAGTWKELSEDELYDYSVAGGTIILDCKGARVIRFKTQAVAVAKAWQLLNADNLIEGTIFLELTDGGPYDQDFSDVSIAPVSDNGNWDSGTKIWSPIQDGRYKLKVEHEGTEFYLSISNAGA